MNKIILFISCTLIFNVYSSESKKSPILLLPGATTNHLFYELGGANSLSSQIEKTGHSFYVLDTNEINTQKEYIDSVIERTSELTIKYQKRPILAGYSMGGMFANKILSLSPNLYEGFILLDSVGVSQDRELTDYYTTNCNQYVVKTKSSIWDPIGENARQGAFKVLEKPDERSLYNSALTNLEFFYLTYSSHLPTDPGKWLFMLPNKKGTFMHMGKTRAIEMIFSLKRRESTNLFKDVYCTIGSKSNKFVLNADKFNGPILGIGAEYGLGPFMDETLNMYSNSSSMEFLLIKGAGHMDIIAAENQDVTVMKHIVIWLNRYF